MKRSVGKRRAIAIASVVVGLATIVSACGSNADSGASASADGTGTQGPASSASEATSSAIDSMEPVELSFAHFGPETDRVGIGITAFEDAVTERTNGKVTFKNSWSASLLGPLDMLKGVGSGVADMGILLSSYYPNDLPVNAWADGFGNAVTGSSSTISQPVEQRTSSSCGMTKSSQEELAKYNVKAVTSTASVPYELLCSKKVESESDASGARVRTSGALWDGPLSAIGMVPVNMPVTEAYEALQRGVIDCVSLNPIGFTVFSLQEVGQEFLPLTLGQGYVSWIVNEDVMQSLPPEVQQIISEEAASAAELVSETSLAEQVEFGTLVEDGTLNFNDPSALASTVEAARQDWLNNMVDTAPDSVVDPQAVVDNYLERRDYWTQKLVEGGYEVTPDFDSASGAVQIPSDVDLAAFYEDFIGEVKPSP